MAGISPKTKKYIGYGLLAGGLGLAAYYAWSMYNASNKISLKTAKLWGWESGAVKIQMVFFNYANVSLPFDGFKGSLKLYLNQNSTSFVELGQIDIRPQGNLPAQAEKELFALVKPNWLTVAQLIPNIVSVVQSGNVLQELAKYHIEIEGTLFFNPLSADIKQRVV